MFAYLEHGSYSAKVDYLCRVAEESRRFNEDGRRQNLRYYEIAGLTVRAFADRPFADASLGPALARFRAGAPGPDVVSIRLVSGIPPISEFRLGKEVYRHAPWVIHRLRDAWAYLGIDSSDGMERLYPRAVFDTGHQHGTIFVDSSVNPEGASNSLTTFPSDQILLARVFADREACYLHASGIILDGKGLAFVGHSEAGKSTMMKLLGEYGEILCDERIIVRRWPEGFRIHGTWSHGELPDVSPADAPLRALMFLEKADTNELIPVTGKSEMLGLVLGHVVKPLVTADWWEKILDLAGKIVSEVPIYRLRFDRSGKVVDLLRRL